MLRGITWHLWHATDGNSNTGTLHWVLCWVLLALVMFCQGRLRRTPAAHHDHHHHTQRAQHPTPHSPARALLQGVLPTDECHNVLINVCTEAKRLDEALELVKRLARKHGTMQAATLNSLTRWVGGWAGETW